MTAKILELTDLVQELNTLRRSGKKLVFTNGCFDILHVGHVRYLAAARSEGDVLVVGLNSDHSTRTIKDQNRPIVSQDQRAEVLSGLGCVDYITIFDEPDPLKLITALKPDVLVKGADWQELDFSDGCKVDAFLRAFALDLLDGNDSTCLFLLSHMNHSPGSLAKSFDGFVVLHG